MPVGSAHSRANGRRHAISDVVVWNGDLIAVSKASGETLEPRTARETPHERLTRSSALENVTKRYGGIAALEKREFRALSAGRSTRLSARTARASRHCAS